MKRIVWSSIVLAVAACVAGAIPAAAVPVGTLFTYQARIDKGGTPYQGTADFKFRLYDAAAGANLVGSEQTVSSVAVPAGGLVSIDLDFGAVFGATALWLEVQLKTPPEVNYTTLGRQRLTAAPFAISSPGVTSQWSNDANGIDYMAGNVGVGTASLPQIKFTASAGAGANAGYFTNNDPDYATLFVRNFDPQGFGLYDDRSAKHYLSGSLGLGTTTPDGRSRLMAVGGTVPIWGQAYGNLLISGYQCGVYG